MKAIETHYNGYRFRSRLEARWAVFFDTLGIRYEYEPEGFELSDGTYYLPDFWLPDLHLWVEVKGVMTDSDMHKIEQFREDHARATSGGNNSDWRNGCLWVVGKIPTEQQLCDSCWQYSFDDFDWPIFSIDFDHPFLPCVCPVCGTPGIEFDGRGDRVCGDKCTDGDKGYTGTSAKVLQAYAEARQARFEFNR